MSARITEAVYDSTEVNAGVSPALDLNYGGMMGVTPRYGFYDEKANKYYGEWISATPYVRENVLPVLLTHPKFMDWLPNRERWLGMCKAVFETEAQSITGLKGAINVDTDSTSVGGAGAQFEVPTNVTLEQTSLSYTFKERMGRPFNKFFSFWIEYGIMDPHTKVAKAVKFLEDPTQLVDPRTGEEIKMYTPDFYTATVLFIEPSNNNTTVEKAWLVFNIFPKSAGAFEGSRDITTAKSTEEITIDFAGIGIHTDAVHALARAIMPKLVSLYEQPDMHMTLPVAGFDPSIKDNDTAHSTDRNQGNGSDLEWDTHPNA
jgi:major virion structural protein|nr:MAG TPA: virion structural protein [Caudoviricetes sp.]DAQ18531.1 MAG TPA: structural protein [Caudoviricetes sp.]DAR26037.1 MAG TPA: virion structural protein [Caudoviricetes sp.]DAX54687.1 MAG TPA: virion structural protein [Caudoviricetes sp.]